MDSAVCVGSRVSWLYHIWCSCNITDIFISCYWGVAPQIVWVMFPAADEVISGPNMWCRECVPQDVDVMNAGVGGGVWAGAGISLCRADGVERESGCSSCGIKIPPIAASASLCLPRVSDQQIHSANSLFQSLPQFGDGWRVGEPKSHKWKKKKKNPACFLRPDQSLCGGFVPSPRFLFVYHDMMRNMIC